MPTKQTGEPKAAVSKVRGFLEALGRWPFDLLTSLARRLWRSGLWLPACLLVATALVIWGFARLNGFASNAVAEAAGILISIPVTVLIVEAILDRRRDRQWAQVREQTASRTGPLPKTQRARFIRACEPRTAGASLTRGQRTGASCRPACARLRRRSAPAKTSPSRTRR